MSRALIILQAGPGTTVQDKGRFGYLAQGCSPGGAADLLALHEGAALLGQSADCAALELAGLGGAFDVAQPTRVALTGAPMPARIGERQAAWNTSHLLQPGQVLTLGPTAQGNYGYLHLGGGLATAPVMGSRSTHLVARIGAPVTNATLPIGEDRRSQTGLTLPPEDRLSGGTIRIIPSAQTGRFAPQDIARLQRTAFTRDLRGNRMGARMAFEGAPFHTQGGLSLLSEAVVPGDIQVTGDGTPFVLLGECQTTGGYPRIGTVIPADIPKVAQARAGVPLRFQMITRAQALKAHAAFQAHLAALPGLPRPLVRDPHDIPDLLSYQLISGAITGDET
ncbi:Allophanate hydrolase 2 subunit 2 [Candidatus Rhodobacter oscarellae]|uniref:Allophanate hydrolase 2 subunit 2 n=1 Tax=Candidatus Rhodobacter oscarellae TaxID=1675527 RepID=A0A0J9E4F9_9RHOB|nr:biotin-dependent carboxyltransferase family protein [Candidatus Rhodobacter lobularis]KMW57660.1 Allophanate hydrolase 2 subunit 2 [Candidatus Rhodobacter lobularis]